MANDVVRIGEYQLRNLLAQQVPFLYFDLRADRSRTSRLLEPARAVGPLNGAELLALFEKEGLTKQSAIVLICENGAKSVAVAEVLADNSYINVFVIEGGVEAFEPG